MQIRFLMYVIKLLAAPEVFREDVIALTSLHIPVHSGKTRIKFGSLSPKGIGNNAKPNPSLAAFSAACVVSV